MRPSIAIVDDDLSICRAIGRLVRSRGMDADVFGSGQALLDRIETKPPFSPDCVVLDVQMPGLSGLDVQRRLRDRDRVPPVIFISGDDSPDVRYKALADGAAAFLVKPFDDELFERTLASALAGAH